VSSQVWSTEEVGNENQHRGLGPGGRELCRNCQFSPEGIKGKKWGSWTKEHPKKKGKKVPSGCKETNRMRKANSKQGESKRRRRKQPQNGTENRGGEKRGVKGKRKQGGGELTTGGYGVKEMKRQEKGGQGELREPEGPPSCQRKQPGVKGQSCYMQRRKNWTKRE